MVDISEISESIQLPSLLLHHSSPLTINCTLEKHIINLFCVPSLSYVYLLQQPIITNIVTDI